jgi:hypothetical protein
VNKLISSVGIALALVFAWKFLAKHPEKAAHGVSEAVSSANNGADSIVTFLTALGSGTFLFLLVVAAVWYVRRLEVAALAALADSRERWRQSSPSLG